MRTRARLRPHTHMHESAAGAIIDLVILHFKSKNLFQINMVYTVVLYGINEVYMKILKNMKELQVSFFLNNILFLMNILFVL
jgi:hypothetical protein